MKKIFSLLLFVFTLSLFAEAPAGGSPFMPKMPQFKPRNLNPGRGKGGQQGGAR